MVRSIVAAAIVALTLVACAVHPPAQQGKSGSSNPTITVSPATRQTFAGFGTSLTNFGQTFQRLTPDVQQSLSKMLWQDLNFRVLRLWFSTQMYDANPAALNLDDFKQRYVDSGLIALAGKNGCTTLLLAPDDVPASFGQSQKSRSGVTSFSDAGVARYAALLATAIKQIRDETGITINVTGILNEPNDQPIQFTSAQWPVMIKTLRAELDNRGLNGVRIIAPEAASCDDTAIGMVDAIRHDSAAWGMVDGIATHTYNMGADDEMAQRLSGSNKGYWQTESSTPGPESSGNVLNAGTSAGRILGDLNHGVTHWIWFIGFEQDDPNDDGTRLIKYDAYKKGGAVSQLYKYAFLQQLSRTFLPGAVVHPCTSSAEGTMTWTYGPKPNILAACAQNPDKTWAIAVVNNTSDSFYAKNVSKWDQQQGGAKSKTITVTLKVTPLASQSSVKFNVHQSGSKQQNADAGTVTAKNGVLTLKLDPMELVTLLSVK